MRRIDDRPDAERAIVERLDADALLPDGRGQRQPLAARIDDKTLPAELALVPFGHG
jgi:hypothetical protein